MTLETIFMNTENSKINEPQKFVYNLPQIFDLRTSNKHFAFQAIYCIWKNVRQQYKTINSK